MSRKALVLCAGRGTRLRPLTHTLSKAALPVAGQPVLKHILAYLHRYGFDDIGVVVASGEQELRRVRPALGQRVRFLVQKRPLGIAHAVQSARRFLGSDPFLLYLGDNLTDEDLQPLLDRFDLESPAAVVALREVADPRAYGVAKVIDGRITAVVEKPKNPPSNLAITGVYLFHSAVHEAIRGLKPSARGELEITDAIGALVAGGRPVLAHRMTGWWQDMGTPEGLLTANMLLLDRLAPEIHPSAILTGTAIQGRVWVAEGCRIENATLRGPLLIGPNCHIKDAYVGPYTSVGEATQINGGSVENSILLPGCRLEGPAFHLEGCLLGRGSVVELNSGRAATLYIGDDGRLQMPPDRR